MHITVWNTVPYKCHNTTHYPFIYVLTCMLMLRAQIIYKMILTLMLFFSVNLSPRPSLTGVFIQWSKVKITSTFIKLTSKQLVVCLWLLILPQQRQFWVENRLTLYSLVCSWHLAHLSSQSLSKLCWN